MDPQYEQRLRDEVIYLHSLWHQGPPKSKSAASHLHPNKSTRFKKEKTPKSDNKPLIQTLESNSSNGAEWPSPAPNPPPTTAWAEFPKTPNSNQPSISSPEEKSKVAANNAQHRALKAVHAFFISKNIDGSDEIDSSSSDEDDDDDDELMEEDYGRDNYTFFLKLFMEEAELRGHYEKNFAKGVFSCLVCGGLGGKRKGRRIKGCLGLVQHSISIARTKKRKAHRAFGQVVCKVLGWDIDNLPAIVSRLSEQKSEELEGNVDSIEGNNGGVVLETGAIASPKGNGNSDVNNVDSIMGNNGVEPEIGAAALPSSNAAEGDMDNVNICINNVDSVEGNEVVPDTGAIDSCARVEEDMENSRLDVGNVESVEGNNDGVAPSAIITSPNDDGADMHSWMLPDANKNLEEFGTGHPHNAEELAAEASTIGPLEENNGIGNELQ